MELQQEHTDNRVICKDGRVFHACELCRKRRSRCDGVRPQCTACKTRGLQCIYKAMRKRGRHGKKSATPAPSSAASTTTDNNNNSSNLDIASAAWSSMTIPATSSSSAVSMNLLDSFPRFFSLPSDMQIPTTGVQQAVAASSVGPLPLPLSPLHLPHHQQQHHQQQHHHQPTQALFSPNTHSLSATQRLMSPEQTATLHPGTVSATHAAFASTLFSSIDTSSRVTQEHLFSSPTSPLYQPQPRPTNQQLPPAIFRSMSTSSGSVFGGGSALGISPTTPAATAPLPSLSMAAVAAASMNGMSTNPAAAAAAAAAAVAAFQLSSPTPQTAIAHQQQQQRQQPIISSGGNDNNAFFSHPHNQYSGSEQEVAALLANQQQQNYNLPPPTSPPATIPLNSTSDTAIMTNTSKKRTNDDTAAETATVQPAPAKEAQRSVTISSPQNTSKQQNTNKNKGRRRQSGVWTRSIMEEDQVIDGLDPDGADDFGRPLFDVTSYPLPSPADLKEHVNGVFEYFYMGVQTMHSSTFRKRINEGAVSPVLIYAIMAVASRYSRKPSLHSLNGMAFLNGDRHASTACGLASVQLNHGDLGTVDTIHGMLFLSVYFMGQGNMLKSRMYLVKAVCTARTMGFQNLDATFVPSSPMTAFKGNYDGALKYKMLDPPACACPKSTEEIIELETKRRIWWFLVFVDYFTANVMNVPLEIPPDSYCVRLPCSDEEWMSPTLTMDKDDVALSSDQGVRDGRQHPYSPPPLADEDMEEDTPRDLGFGDRQSSAQQRLEYLRLNGFHDCRPPWLYHPGSFYLERLMIEFCDHLRRLNNLRSLAIRSFFHVEPVFVEENYPYLKRRRQQVPWTDRVEKVKSSWSWLHLQLNKWLDSILLRFSEVINRVSLDQYKRQYRHQYYYYLIAAHSAIIMSHGVILQLFKDFSRYICQQQQSRNCGSTRPHTPNVSSTAAPSSKQDSAETQPSWASPSGAGVKTPPFEFGSGGGENTTSLSEGLSEYARGQYGSAMEPLITIANNMAAAANGNGSVHSSSGYGSVIGSPICSVNNISGGSTRSDDMDMNDGSSSPTISPHALFNGPHSASHIQRELFDMANIAWDGCVSTAEQLASILRGKHPKFVLLGSAPIEEFHRQVRSNDANILSPPDSVFNAPGTGPGADNPILSDPDFYMRLQPSTAWWMFLVAQVQVGHIKRLLKESEGNFKANAKKKQLIAKRAAADAANGENAASSVDSIAEEKMLDMSKRLQKPVNKVRPLSYSVSNSAAMLATAVHLSKSAPSPTGRKAKENRATIRVHAQRLVRAYENLSCMVKVLEGMQQYWQCMDYVRAIQDLLKGSEDNMH